MRDEKQGREVESEERRYRCAKIRRKKIQVRENQKKEDTGARKPEERRYSRAKVRKVANGFVFPMICQLDSWTGRSISVFALPSVTHNNQSLLYVSYS